ncbi:MAG: hypothetical protein JWP94_481 [Mucilaginibacter sp.]|nr:hypothetical protein [Mucilaginibacter sp.]
MKTTEKNANVVQSTAAKTNETANKIPNRPSLTQKEAKEDERATNQTPAQAPQTEEAKVAGAKTGSPLTVGSEPDHAKQQTAGQELTKEPKHEPAKSDNSAVRPALNLEQTLKSVNGLHRLSIQRLALIARIKTLEDFEVKLAEENDELETNPYQGCKLIIKDDKGREFTTNTPNLIRMVSQFIFDACNEKLADIEASIVFPNA